jgi:opacity protein-like surface antigen
MHGLPRHVLALCVSILGVGAASASAQAVPAVEVSGGYQFLNISAEGGSESLPAGWYADVAANLTPMIGVVFQVGGNYKTIDESIVVGGVSTSASADAKVHGFLGGVRLNFRSQSPIVPFAQVLAGAIHSSVDVSASATLPGMPPIAIDLDDSRTNFGLQAGGGMNVAISKAVGLRVGADYLRVVDDDNGANVFRFHAGVVFTR